LQSDPLARFSLPLAAAASAAAAAVDDDFSRSVIDDYSQAIRMRPTETAIA
jgi:hypothetical protein